MSRDLASDLSEIPLGTAEEERQRAKNWMDTAAQHCRNEFYWKARAKRAENRHWNADLRAIVAGAVSRPSPPSDEDKLMAEAVHLACRMQEARLKKNEP